MNKYIYYILAFILIIFLVILFYKPKQRNYYDYPETIKITNLTNYNEADTILYIMLNKTLKIDTININILYNDNLLNSLNLEAVTEYTGIDNTYNIFLNRKIQRPLSSILSHEVVHIRQYYFKYLELKENLVIYKDDVYDYFIEYKERPWEKEAFLEQNNILREYVRYQYK